MEKRRDSLAGERLGHAEARAEIEFRPSSAGL
jgi:hypothetical protein